MLCCALLLHFFQDLIIFMGSLFVKFLLIGSQVIKQFYELSGVHPFFVGNIPQHRSSEWVVDRVRQLGIELRGFVLCRDEEANGSHKVFIGQLTFGRKTGKR